jgi:hypothetical protein
MLALMTNCLAFYLGAVLIERMGVFWGVTVFLVTALGGTIISSIIEKCLRSLLFSEFTPISNRNALSAVTVSATVRGACPKPGSDNCADCTIGF